jgi:hypothetical protein
MRFWVVIVVVLSLSACKTFMFNQQGNVLSTDRCLYPDGQLNANSDCDLAPWLDYWLMVSQLNWQQREPLLANLTNSDEDRVKSIFLSHVSNTPYQNRLRAQLVAQQFVLKRKGELAELIRLLVFLPAQEKLELESALTTQTQFSIKQEKKLQIQQEKLIEQELQINKLLQIEKNIVENPVIEKPIEVK